MTLKQKLNAEGLDVRRRERADSVEFVADLGPGTDAAVDVVGDTVIVAAGDQHYEVDGLADAGASINNGVLTVTTGEEQ